MKPNSFASMAHRITKGNESKDFILQNSTIYILEGTAISTGIKVQKYKQTGGRWLIISAIQQQLIIGCHACIDCNRSRAACIQVLGWGSCRKCLHYKPEASEEHHKKYKDSALEIFPSLQTQSRTLVRLCSPRSCHCTHGLCCFQEIPTVFPSLQLKQ